jgi:hypothetical protein
MSFRESFSKSLAYIDFPSCYTNVKFKDLCTDYESESHFKIPQLKYFIKKYVINALHGKLKKKSKFQVILGNIENRHI